MSQLSSKGSNFSRIATLLTMAGKSCYWHRRLLPHPEAQNACSNFQDTIYRRVHQTGSNLFY